MIIAGDLYDGDWKDYNTGLFFVKEMTRLREAGIPVVIAAGNHDAASRLTRDLRLPLGVKLLSHKAPETVILEEPGVAIHGRSFPTQAVTDDLAASYPSARDGLLNVGVLHTALDGREGHAPYAPCSLVELQTKGYDYWALGHVHRREVVSENPYVVFPGNTQGRHARELGPKGASVVAVDDGGIVSVTPAILDAVRWETCLVGAAEASSGAEVLELVADGLAGLAESADGRLLAVRVLVTGQSAAHADLATRPEHWENQVRALALDSGADIWVEKVKLATQTALDIEALAQRDDPVGSLIRTLRELSSDDLSLQDFTNVFADLAQRLPAEYGELEDALDLREPRWTEGDASDGRRSAPASSSRREHPRVRILSLDLLRFGPFAAVSLEFGKNGRNFQVVQGSNEAGKSTALRALTAALFGIPERTVDGHRHSLADLRVGIGLIDSLGQELYIVRRKGRKNTVLDRDGNPLDDAILAPYLRGVELGVFEAMFGLNHQALIEGGKDLLAGKGELGASLFGAGAGFANLHRMRIGLRDEADAIFSPRAQKPPLNLALRAYGEVRRRSTDLALRPNAYKELEGKLSAASERLLGLEDERRKQAATSFRLERLERVLPRVTERQEVLEALERLGEVPSLPDGCSLARVQAQTEIGSIATQESLLLAEEKRLRGERDELEIPEALLTRAEELETLRDLLGARRKALADLPGVRARVEAAESDAIAILRDLGYSPILAGAEELRVDVATRTRVREHQKTYVGLEADGKAMKRNILEADTALGTLRGEQKRVPEPKDAEALQRAIAYALKQGDLEKQLRNLGTQIEVVQKRASDQLSALLLWGGSLEEAARLALLPVESVDGFERDFVALRATKDRLRGQGQGLGRRTGTSPRGT